jgi:D-3-phosphoglycerate dehydrogenase
MKVLVTDELHQEGIKLLEKNLDLDYSPCVSQANLEKIVPGYDALVVRARTRLDRKILEKAKKLKYVVSCSVGLDSIDMEYCNAKGIDVIFVPGVNANAVAEHAIMLIFSCLKNLKHYMKRPREKTINRELISKTVGVVGLGNIGSIVAKKMSCLGAKKVIGYDPLIDDSVFKKLGVEKKSELDDLIEEADVITIHVPLIDETKRLFDRKRLSSMRKKILINTSRGELIDEKFLLEMVEKGDITVGLDVLKDDSFRNNPFRDFENAIITPHVAAYAEESFRLMSVLPIKAFLEKVKSHNSTLHS